MGLIFVVSGDGPIIGACGVRRRRLASSMAAKNNEISDRVPIPPTRVRPRMFATGVSISRRPAFAMSPATKAKSPRAISNKAGRKVPPSGNSLSVIRALFDKLKVVPSMNRTQTRPSAVVSMMSPWKTGSPTLRKIRSDRMTVAVPITRSILPTVNCESAGAEGPAPPPSPPESSWEPPRNSPAPFACPPQTFSYSVFTTCCASARSLPISGQQVRRPRIRSREGVC